MAKKTVRIKLRSYDHRLVDVASTKIIETIKKSGAEVKGPIPLPTEKQIYTILRSPHVNKKSREQFEMRTHKRLLDVVSPSKATIDALGRLDLPSGVDVEIKL